MPAKVFQDETSVETTHLTEYHAKYYAYELTKRCPSGSLEKLTNSLQDAQVDLNPHQVEAALFAFQSPLSNGALLADEVGLGKTIEAGIVISQKWAELKRRILIIVPSNLRSQWKQELQEKFFLPSVILETKSFNHEIKQGNLNPFDQKEIILCSYQFVKSKEPYVQQLPWDLVVIDEAHRLRNVYKPTNKIGNAIKRATSHAPKVLLTATPLQNTLLELYGLVSLIDDYTFGDLKSFKSKFSRLADEEDYDDLKERLKPICKRTLRKQVLAFVRYTSRHAITQEFVPSEDEELLYDLVSEYLRTPKLYALPSAQRNLMTLILRKLLASSTYAISGTLEALSVKLENIVEKHAELSNVLEEAFAEDFETFDELKDEWDEETADEEEGPIYTENDIRSIKEEIKELKEFYRLAESIQKNSKGEALLTALEKGFAKAEEGGASKKAIIFTESTRTQKYLRDILEKTAYQGKIVLFNGSNNDPKSKEIYKNWLEKHQGTDKVSGSRTADIRASIVDYFRNEAVIMIATEAAAEGINLQFCSLVVNYDLPWNPQRIEQRIGRCHRYGQKHDVVVINFLNKKNAADQRVFELLDKKFKLFSGVFGASDEVLGVVESGVDFEKRIAAIYQNCPTAEEQQAAFDQLQQDMAEPIDEKMKSARRTLMENFDEEVHEKLKVCKEQSSGYLSKYEEWLWLITKFFLKPYANFNHEESSFHLTKNPFEGETIHSGPYRIGKNVEDANVYRIGHPLARQIVEHCKAFTLHEKMLTFNYTNTQHKKITILEELMGQSGWICVTNVTIDALEVEDFVQFQGITDDGKTLTSDQCQRLFSLPAIESAFSSELNDQKQAIRESFKTDFEQKFSDLLKEIETRNGDYFILQMDKLDKWGEDQRTSLKLALKEFDDEIKDLKKQSRLAQELPERLVLEKKRRGLEKKRDEAWKEYDHAAKGIDKQKDELIDNIQDRLKQNSTVNELFFIRWQLI